MSNSEFEKLDEAFLNSMLSYGVYTGRQWTLQRLEDPKQEASFLKEFLDSSKLGDAQNLTMRKAYEASLALFNRQTFEAVDVGLVQAQQVVVTSQTYGYSYDYNYQKGDYEAMDNLARAGIFRSKNDDGTYNLHLAFRGTDTNARSFMTFVAKAYLDMSAYYDCFKPLERAVLEYASDPANKISCLHVSGHSLGGAMVQEFFNSPEVKNSGLEMKGFTYGSPGSRKKSFYNLLPNIYQAIKFQKLSVIMHGIKQFFSSDGEMDERITQYEHLGDLIPRAGQLLYDMAGKSITLRDEASKDFLSTHVLQGKSLTSPYQPNNHVGNFYGSKENPDINSVQWQQNGVNTVLSNRPVVPVVVGVSGAVFSPPQTPSIETPKLIEQKTAIPQKPLELPGGEYEFIQPQQDQQRGWLAKTGDFIKKAITFDYHDMLRYTFNLEHRSQQLLAQQKDNVPGNTSSLMPHLSRFQQFRGQLHASVQVIQQRDMMTQKILNMRRAETLQAGGAIHQAPDELAQRIMGLRQKAISQTLTQAATGVNRIS